MEKHSQLHRMFTLAKLTLKIREIIFKMFTLAKLTLKTQDIILLSYFGKYFLKARDTE